MLAIKNSKHVITDSQPRRVGRTSIKYEYFLLSVPAPLAHEVAVHQTHRGRSGASK